tara:strand:- start:27456 stop:27752 length:297 start_codon:yes stop_codon:yes gene_type:complete
MKNIGDALLSLVPGAEWVTDGEKVTQWLSPDIDQPTQSEIDAEVARLQAEYDLQEYARSRQSAYPPIGDQLDSLFHAGVFPEEMAAQLQAVKDAYPKP